MTLPFHPRPGDPDADHLNTLLDAHRSGTRAPDAASPETDEAAALANAADQLRGLVRRADAPAAAYLDRHPLQTRWEDILSTAFPAAPQNVTGDEAFAPSAPVSNRTRRAIMPQPPHPLNAWLSAAIVAVFLLGTIGGTWWLGPAGDGSNDDSWTRYAAQPLETGTPEQAASVWFTPVMQKDCVADAMEQDEYADIMRTRPTPEPRSYLPVTPANTSTSIEVATAGRIREACLIYGEMEQWRTLETPSALYARTAGQPVMSPEEADEVRRLSEHLPIVPFDELFTYTQERMPEELATRPEGSHEAQIATSTYLPDYAYQLADGRIAVAIGTIFWANPRDEHFKASVEENPDAQGTAYAVFVSVDGQWLYDQRINVCVGECEDVLGGTGTAVASPVATPNDSDVERAVSRDAGRPSACHAYRSAVDVSHTARAAWCETTGGTMTISAITMERAWRQEIRITTQ